jgi:hypothetical protein
MNETYSTFTFPRTYVDVNADGLIRQIMQKESPATRTSFLISKSSAKQGTIHVPVDARDSVLKKLKAIKRHNPNWNLGIGRPVPGGKFVATITDVPTETKETERQPELTASWFLKYLPAPLRAKLHRHFSQDILTIDVTEVTTALEAAVNHALKTSKLKANQELSEIKVLYVSADWGPCLQQLLPILSKQLVNQRKWVCSQDMVVNCEYVADSLPADLITESLWLDLKFRDLQDEISTTPPNWAIPSVAGTVPRLCGLTLTINSQNLEAELPIGPDKQLALQRLPGDSLDQLMQRGQCQALISRDPKKALRFLVDGDAIRILSAGETGRFRTTNGLPFEVGKRYSLPLSIDFQSATLTINSIVY